MSMPFRLSLIALAAFLLTIPVLADAGVEGHWKGEIAVPGSPLEIDVDLAVGDDGAVSGDISIPIQGIKDFALVDVAVDGANVVFRIADIPGDPTFNGTVDGDTLAGAFTQGGAELTFELVRGDSPAAMARVALEGFEEVMDQAIEDFNVPGLAFAVVAGGEVVFAHGSGFRDIEAEKPVTPDTLFAIGSTTKAMTSTVLAGLAEEGKLELDGRLLDYLPRFRLKDPTITQMLTPRDLVTHRSGLPRHDLLWYGNVNDGTRAEMVARLAHLELAAGLRQEFQYNNLMYLTAGHLIEELTEMSWEEATAKRLLAPLGMERTVFNVADVQEDDDFAQPYREDDDENLELIPFRDIRLVGPAGSVHSSIHEMSKWLLFNLSGGKTGDGTQLIQAATLADIHSPHMAMGGASSPEVGPASYGLGWMIDSYRGHQRVHHNGGIDGFITTVRLYPQADMGMVAFTNIGSGLVDLIADTAADLLLELEPKDWLGEALEIGEEADEINDEAEARKGETRFEGTSLSHDVADYAGEYVHPGYGTLEIHENDGALSLKFNGIEAPLEHWHYNVLSGAEADDDKTFEDQKFLFHDNYDGLIAEVEVRMEPRTDPIVFEKQPDSRLYDPEYLKRFVGDFDLPGQRISIALQAGRLHAVLAGQPTLALAPTLSGRFELEEFAAIQLGFAENDAGEVTGLTFYQPNGIFTAQRASDEEETDEEGGE